MRRTNRGIALPRLREIRDERKLTRIAIASAIGIDTATIYRLETGRGGASHQTAADLAAYFGVPIEALQKNIHENVA